MANSHPEVSIAIVGHTNVGKTTLIRTITRKKVGEIGDVAGLTKRAEPERHATLQATFVDCPGFERAGTILHMFDQLGRLSTKMELEARTQRRRKDYRATAELELNALQALRAANAAIYVASLEIVPDTGHDDEIALVMAQRVPTVAVLHKRQVLTATNRGDAPDRVAQWTQTLRNGGIQEVISFDAHWDKPRAVDNVHGALFRVLDGEVAQQLRDGLERFKAEREAVRRRAAGEVAKFISAIRGEVEEKRELTESIDAASEAAKKALLDQFRNAQKEFLENVAKIYAVASNATLNFAEVDESRLDDESEGQAVGLAGGLAGGSVAAAIGGALGFLCDVFLMGGSLGAGCILGAKLGACLGTIAGGVAGVEVGGRKRIVRVGLGARVEDVAHWALTIVCAEACHGFGLGEVLSEPRVRELDADVRARMARQKLRRSPSWEQDAEDQLRDWCCGVLEDFETR